MESCIINTQVAVDGSAQYKTIEYFLLWLAVGSEKSTINSDDSTMLLNERLSRHKTQEMLFDENQPPDQPLCLW